MLKFLRTGTLVVLGVGLAAIANAAYSGPARAGSVMPEAGAYDALSPANKKIAEALFNGQIVTPDGKAPLSLDLIAASKERSGWGRIFRQLKKDGLIDARNLHDLMRRSTKGRNGTLSGEALDAHHPTIVTTAGGRQIIVDEQSIAPQTAHNIGRQMDRRGSESIGDYSESLFSSGSTYRGRVEFTSEARDASSLGIVTGKGAGTANYIATIPK